MSILVGENVYEQDFFKGKSLRHTLDGDGQVVKIASSGVTVFDAAFGSNTMAILLESELSQEPIIYNQTDVQTDTKYSWIEIFDFTSLYVVSNDSINSFENSPGGNSAYIQAWDKDQEEFFNISEILDLFSITDISLTGYPGIKALSKVSDYEGNFAKLFSFLPNKVTFMGSSSRYGVAVESASDFGEIGDPLPNLIDGDISTTNQMNLYRTNTGFTIDQIFLEVEAPKDLNKIDYEKIYILADFDGTLDVASTDPHPNIAWASIDSLGFVRNFKLSASFDGEAFTGGDTKEVRSLPGTHYNLDTGNTAQFEQAKDALDGSGFYDNSIMFRAFPNQHVIISWVINPAVASNMVLKLREISFIAEQNVNIVNNDVFAKVKGEEFSGEETDNVYNIIRSILQTYDGVTDFAYNNLEAERRAWKAGRQLLDRKSSFEYLKEIARQGFIGIYPTRLGERGFKAFREDVDFNKVFASDNFNVLKDSITRYELSDINLVYNEFQINYEQNLADKTFGQSLWIKKADESAFPGEFVSTGTDTSRSFTDCTITERPDGSFYAVFTFGADPTWAASGDTVSLDDSAAGIGRIVFGTIFDKTATQIQVNFTNTEGLANGANTSTGTLWSHSTSVQSWKTFVGGFTGYNRAEELWDVCHESYLRTGVIRPLPASLGNCKWYIEESNFNVGAPGDSSTAHKYLAMLVEWTTRQKEIAEFAIPLTAGHVILEILTPMIFRDQKYTNGTNRQGYITKLKIDPPRDRIVVEATLEPADIISVTDCLIVETGFADVADDIDESGSGTEDITETGLC
jgi:hypothetical protein